MLGYSVEHRALVAWMREPKGARESVLVGSIAGDEPAGIAVRRLLASRPVIAGVRLWSIPAVNPDGVARQTRQNAHGVDLNRNFPFHWRHLGRPGSRYYSGPRRSSEPETRAVEHIHSPRPSTIWLHQPYGLIDDSQGPGWAEQQLHRSLELLLQRLPDYLGSAIGEGQSHHRPLRIRPRARSPPKPGNNPTRRDCASRARTTVCYPLTDHPPLSCRLAHSSSPRARRGASRQAVCPWMVTLDAALGIAQLRSSDRIWSCRVGLKVPMSFASHIMSGVTPGPSTVPRYLVPSRWDGPRAGRSRNRSRLGCGRGDG